MNELPELIAQLLFNKIIMRRSPAFICIDKDGLVKSGGGQLELYGIKELPIGKDAKLNFLFLEGIIPLDTPYLILSYMHLESGPPTDIYIILEEGLHWVVFLDATEDEQQRRRHQQTSYDLKLLQKKQLGLMKELELANSELENRVAQRTAELVSANEMLKQEIKERQKAEEEVRRQRDRSQMYLDVAGVMLLVIDQDYRVAMINRKGCTILEAAESDVVGKNWFERFIPERIRAQQREILSNMMETRTSSDDLFEGAVLSLAGQERIIAWRYALLEGDEGLTFGVLCSGEDITVRRQTEEALRKSQEQLIHAQKMEAIGKLASGVAHDFNNLMTVVGGYSDLMLQTLKKEDPSYEDLQEIKRAGERAAVLTRQLLAFSSKQAMQQKILNVNTVVEDIQKMLRRLLTPLITVTTELDPNMVLVKADPGHLEQVIMNLVVNARDAMQDGGIITIKTTTSSYKGLSCEAEQIKFDTCACLSITDTGTGMEKTVLERIFEPFFTTKPVGQGTGLGLSVVYGIVKQHRGAIKVTSAPGKGTRFDIYLPGFREISKVEETQIMNLADLQGAGEHILLVDYDQKVRAFTSRVLVENGYRVSAAETATQALDIFMRNKGLVDFLLTEMILPDRSGLLLAEQLTSFKPNLPVVITSGNIDQDFHHLIVNVKKFSLLAKPFTTVDLLRVMQAIFNSFA